LYFYLFVKGAYEIMRFQWCMALSKIKLIEIATTERDLAWLAEK
jgi:hypothetical protein